MDSFEADYFKNTEIYKIELEVLSDFWQALKEEIALNDWEVDEGLRFILASGLYAVSCERLADQTGSKEKDAVGEAKQMHRDRMELESRYAVMKYKVFQFMQAVKALQWKLNVTQTELEGMETAYQKLMVKMAKILQE